MDQLSLDQVAKMVLGQDYIICCGDPRGRIMDLCRFLGVEVN